MDDVVARKVVIAAISGTKPKMENVPLHCLYIRIIQAGSCIIFFELYSEITTPPAAVPE